MVYGEDGRELDLRMGTPLFAILEGSFTFLFYVFIIFTIFCDDIISTGWSFLVHMVIGAERVPCIWDSTYIELDSLGDF